MQPPILSEATWVYNPLQLDAYLLHLASIYQVCVVTAAEDIYSGCNTLLLQQGLALTPAIAQRMLPFCLRAPIEDSIVLSHVLDEKTLLKDLSAVMAHDDILFSCNEQMDLVAVLTAYCPLVIQSNLLRQKLSVMAYAMPDLYQHTLYCTWLSLCIAKEIRLSRDDIAAVIVAALAHDIGMLHIDKGVLQKTTAISAEDWMRIQRHVVIGKCLIKSDKNIPPQVAQAVYEHHEQSDGTGYPLAKLENELGLLGQILNVADAIVAIHCNYEKNRGRSWRDVVPLIQMNSQAYLTRANEILLAIVRRADLPQKNVVQGDATPDFIADLLEKNRQLALWFGHMRESLLSLGFRHGDKRLHALQNVMLRLTTSAEGSGIFNESHWEQLLAPDGQPSQLSSQGLAQECEKMHLMQQEIIFHLQRLSHMTHLYLESGESNNKDIRFALARSLQSAQKYLL